MDMANNQIKIRIVENHTEEVKALLKERKKKIFHAWGIKWVERVTPLVPVDTGRLRQSMHFRTRTDDVAVGTNVKYAPYINNGFKSYKGKKYMEKSTIENKDEYKLIAEQILKE